MWAKLWSLLILRYDIWWDSVYYRIFPDTPECIFEGEGRASDSDLPLSWCRLCTMCDVRVTTILLWCRQHCPLIGQHAPDPDWRDQGRDSEGLALKHFQVFGNPSFSQSRQTKQQSIAKFLEKHNEFSTILLTKLCLMSVQGSCTAPTRWRPSLSHMLTCSTVCSNMNR